MKAGRFQVFPHIRDDGGRFDRQRDRRMLHEPVDVVDPKADAFVHLALTK